MGTQVLMFTTRGEAQYEEGCIKGCIVCSRQGSHFHFFMKVVQMLSPNIFATLANFFDTS